MNASIDASAVPSLTAAYSPVDDHESEFMSANCARAPRERMQAGRRSPACTRGAFSPVLDACPHRFQRWMATRYAAATRPGVP